MEFELTQSLDILERTPEVLARLLRGADAGWHTANEGPDTWSAADVVGHLAHGEEANWIPRARMILEEGDAREFEPFDRFAQFDRFAGWSIDRLLDLFAERRKASLAIVRSWNLTAAQLDLRGLHPAFGPVTLRQLLATWAVHDLDHIAQITRVMAKRYAVDVGPWREYLSILKR